MPVRCCADEPIPSASSCQELGWDTAARFGSLLVCGESYLNLGGCSGEKTHQQAKLFCEDAGSRLCSAEELQSDEARGSGCSYDRTMVWSSSPCSEGFLQAMGSTLGGTIKECIEPKTRGAVRCCADVPLPKASASNCESLGWGNALAFGSSSVCGESDLGLGGCSGFMAWGDAASFCSAGGARLCTLEELQADDTRSTGCGYDTKAVWSSSRCNEESGFQVAPGSSVGGSWVTCLAESSKRNVRCCADAL